MSPLRLVIAGLSLVLLACVLFWMLDNAAEPDSFGELLLNEALVFSQFFVGSLGGAGIFLILRGMWLAGRKDLPPRLVPRMFPELRLRNLTAWKGRTHSPSLVAKSLNAFSVSWICVLMTLVIIFMMFGSRRSTGLRIDWWKPSHISATESPWPETMSVYIGDRGQFYVNGKAIKTKDLDVALKDQLGRRAVWTVYVEADPNSMFADTVYAIDTIQGVGGKVVWITPKMRAEWKKRNYSTRE